MLSIGGFEWLDDIRVFKVSFKSPSHVNEDNKNDNSA
jgi:hypothetical protein